MQISICRRVNTFLLGAACLISLGLASPAARAQTRAQAKAQQRAAKADMAAAQRFARINALLGQLNLTTDQKRRIVALQADAERKIAASMIDRTLTPAIRKEQIRVQTQGALAQTRGILVQEQRRRLTLLARQARLQRKAAGAVNVSGTTAVSPSMVTADGEEVQF